MGSEQVVGAHRGTQARRRACLCALLLSFWPTTARGAPELPAVEQRSELELSPPKLLERVEAEYPQEARRARLEAVVSLLLVVDTEGAVKSVELVEPRGHGFDEAARAAALGFRFEPAKRRGVPVSSRIRYDYSFRLPELPPIGDPEAKVAPAVRESPKLAPTPPLEVTVRGATVGERAQRSSEAVRVLETRSAQKDSADMGEVLNRSAGVNLRRGGGLGAFSSFSLNGLREEQVRVTVDELPLSFAGLGPNLASIPVGLIERVELYRGVTPLRFGSDALGGVVNLVTSSSAGASRSAGSFQVGSFGTYRLAGFARARLRRGLIISGHAFLDDAQNRYPVDVMVAGRDGRLHPVSVHRFHDAYRAAGASVDAALTGQSWAKRLALRVFANGLEKQLQNNLAMTTPYGEVEYAERSLGGSIRYETPQRSDRGLTVVLGYSRRRLDFSDQSEWVYDWLGNRVRRRARPGEVGQSPSDATLWDHTTIGRLTGELRPGAGFVLRLNVTPSMLSRVGTERAISGTSTRDPLAGNRRLLTLVEGFEASVGAEGPIEDTLFVKHYLYSARSRQSLPQGQFEELSSGGNALGVGDALRVTLVPGWLLKSSYELATRLPRGDELFGDGVLIRPNPKLAPERSHNLNLGAEVTAEAPFWGVCHAELYGFLRATRDQIEPIGVLDLSYQNVSQGRTLGVEALLRYVTPRDWLALDANLTWIDLRNVATTGALAAFKGDRVPHRPWLLGNAALTLKPFGALAGMSTTWSAHYTHSFYRTWESLGSAQHKDQIPSQLVHHWAVRWTVQGALTVTSSFEIANVTNAKTYDYFGVQKPGRAAFFKGTFEY